ncbi:GNAT family N-acetyltransferase [Extibacter muris]|uniref:GNAT family N-acetyltransferase n=1 Tax=Extibacter muris TaxID=1796622 RepID=A0A4R4FBZ8_9FIRM|nr:GNAT family N-acetyltransferase [Extibacter muris]MCU0081166.1 GNAT family N-acetyltransferase [Extibacter muris]TDA20163.1 GNAT family N-acetyltransferase [Extibacter muris]
MNFALIPLCEEHKQQFKKDMQTAFQQGAVEKFDKIEEVLPESDIDHSLSTNGAIAYEAVADGASVGGAIVIIDEKSQHNHLDFLFVKVGVQSKGIGQFIWNTIERLHSKTKVWETCTPYFEKRNIHFYVNRCGFHIVEFYNKYHPAPHTANEYGTDNDSTNEYFDGMFRFEKVMLQKRIIS